MSGAMAAPKRPWNHLLLADRKFAFKLADLQFRVLHPAWSGDQIAIPLPSSQNLQVYEVDPLCSMRKLEKHRRERVESMYMAHYQWLFKKFFATERGRSRSRSSSNSTSSSSRSDSD